MEYKRIPGYDIVIQNTFSSIDNVLTRYGGGTAVGPQPILRL
jgi:hypothetical protein